MNNYPALITQLTGDIHSALEINSAGGYNRLTGVLSQLERLAEADVQESSGVSLLGVIRKLKAGEMLTAEDRNTVRWCMVSDSRLQVHSKDDLDHMRVHLERLASQMTQAAGQGSCIEGLLTLQGLFREAGRLSAELGLHAQQNERVAIFEQTINNLREDERELLIRLLEQKIKGG